MITIPIEDFVDNIRAFKAMQKTGFPNTIQAFMDTMNRVKNYWKDVATGNVQIAGVKPRFGQRYANAIDATEAWKEVVTDKYVRVIIEPDPETARLCENFIPAYDLKPGMLNSPYAHDIKSGPNKGKKYFNVPFRHGWGEAAHHLKGMPASVHRLINNKSGKEAQVSKTVIETKVLQGKIMERMRDVTVTQGDRIKLDELPEKHQELQMHRFLQFDKKSKQFHMKEYQHKSPIYEGMVRVEKLYETSTQTQYRTWRRVGPNSSPLSWWHPGFARNPISEHVESKAREWLIEAIQAGMNDDWKIAFSYYGGN